MGSGLRHCPSCNAWMTESSIPAAGFTGATGGTGATGLTGNTGGTGDFPLSRRGCKRRTLFVGSGSSATYIASQLCPWLHLCSIYLPHVRVDSVCVAWHRQVLYVSCRPPTDFIGTVIMRLGAHSIDCKALSTQHVTHMISNICRCHWVHWSYWQDG